MMDVKRIEISKTQLTRLVEHAKATSPYESVSIISGVIKDDTAIAEKIYTPENIDKSTTTFTVEPLTLLEIYTEIEEENRQVVGIYHTHPAPATPSATDRLYMEVNPCVWLISSTKSPEKPKGYLLKEDKTIEEVEIKITNG